MKKIYDWDSDRMQYIATFADVAISGIRWNDPTGALEEEMEEMRNYENSTAFENSVIMGNVGLEYRKARRTRHLRND